MPSTSHLHVQISQYLFGFFRIFHRLQNHWRNSAFVTSLCQYTADVFCSWYVVVTINNSMKCLHKYSHISCSRSLGFKLLFKHHFSNSHQQEPRITDSRICKNNNNNNNVDPQTYQEMRSLATSQPALYLLIQTKLHRQQGNNYSKCSQRHLDNRVMWRAGRLKQHLSVTLNQDIVFVTCHLLNVFRSSCNIADA